MKNTRRLRICGRYPEHWPVVWERLNHDYHETLETIVAALTTEMDDPSDVLARALASLYAQGPGVLDRWLTNVRLAIDAGEDLTAIAAAVRKAAEVGA